MMQCLASPETEFWEFPVASTSLIVLLWGGAAETILSVVTPCPVWVTSRYGRLPMRVRSILDSVEKVFLG